jgi:YjbE family integral membrane protein
MHSLSQQIVQLIQVIVIDLVLAGDNAVIVGMAAAQVSPDLRFKVIFWGVAGAVVLRLALAAVATELLAFVGLTLAGGILLAWVAWKLYREIRRTRQDRGAGVVANARPDGNMGFRGALIRVIVADLSMSLDNVLAVAGAAKGDLVVLGAGLAVAVIAMALIANVIARLLERYAWISWIGLLVILYVAADMIWRGAAELGCLFVVQSTCERGLLAIIKSLF